MSLTMEDLCIERMFTQPGQQTDRSMVDTDHGNRGFHGVFRAATDRCDGFVREQFRLARVLGFHLVSGKLRFKAVVLAASGRAWK